MSRKESVSDRRAKAAAIQAEARRKQRRTTVALASIVGVVVLVLALLVVKAVTGDNRKSSAASGSLSGSVAQAVASVPASVFDSVGVGTAKTGPQPVKGGTALTADGKPRVLYVGAEYCPYCAAERWAMVAALSRFGSFSNLGSTTSASQDVFPSTPTLSFHGATYTSKYLSFTGYETQSNQPQGNAYAPLDTLSAADQKLLQKYDAAPYVSAQSAGSIPFVLLGGIYLINGASYDPGILAGMTHAEVAKALSDKSSDVAKGVDGTANLITASLCTLTKDQPAAVCGSSGVKAAAAKLG